jgi:hypothetical protein
MREVIDVVTDVHGEDDEVRVELPAMREVPEIRLLGSVAVDPGVRNFDGPSSRTGLPDGLQATGVRLVIVTVAAGLRVPEYENAERARRLRDGHLPVTPEAVVIRAEAEGPVRMLGDLHVGQSRIRRSGGNGLAVRRLLLVEVERLDLARFEGSRQVHQGVMTGSHAVHTLGDETSR